MIAKPIHRRRSLVSDDRSDSSRGKFWILPALLFSEALFVGSTFNTLPTTLGCSVFALLLTGFCLLWIGARDADSTDVRNGRQSSKSTPGGSDTPMKNHLPDRSETLKTRQRPLRLWRSILVVPTVLIVAVVGASLRVGHHLSENLNPVAMVVDLTAHVVFLISLTLWVFYPRRGHPGMLVCGLLLVLTTVTAGGVSHTINGQLVAALATVVAFAFASEQILGKWQIERENRKREKRLRKESARLIPAGPTVGPMPLPASTVSISEHRGRSPMLFSVLALSVLLMSTSAAGHLAASVVPGLQLELFDRLSQSLEAVTSGSIIGGSRYVRGSRLGSVRRHMIGDPAETALSAFAETAPGYLRGTVFDTYKQGAWSADSERSYYRTSDPSVIRPRPAVIEMPGKTLIQQPGVSQLNRFRVRKNPGGPLIGTVEVHNVPMKGRIVFTSLSTDWIEAATYGVSLTHHDMVKNGVDTQEPYILGISTDTPQEKLGSVRKNLMLSLVGSLRGRISPLAKKICDGRLTAPAKARAIEDYFQSNYSYSLRGTATPADMDPVVHFLETQHPAHCEFFATASALMLRSVGVPTRYVTGYVAKEKSEDDKYWLARNKDAHAWVEAYDEITERWFPVESTVGRTYQTLLTEQESIAADESATDGLLDFEDDQSLIARLLGLLQSFRATDSLTYLFRFAQLPLFCLVVALLWIRHRQKLRAGGDPMEYESRQMLQRVDRKVRKHALVRAPNETLHQFASRVESVGEQRHDVSTFLQSAANWYRDFAAARYRGLMPTPMDKTGQPAVSAP